jgi:septal ring factor EnvC (AmiA/AmiB activator)
MSTTPNNPVPSQPQVVEVSSTPRWIPALFVLAFALTGYLLYASRMERQDLQQTAKDSQQRSALLMGEIEKAHSQIADLRGELHAASQKLGLTQDELARARAAAQNLRQAQETSDKALRAQIGQVQQDTTTKIGQVSTELSGTKTDVEATKKDLADTKSKLERTSGDLGVQSGLIARNHDEVEELKRLGERNIFEFNLPKGKSMQRVGPIQVALRKVDTKRSKYTMDVVADDKNIEKKDKTIGEPVQFYVHGARVPFEIVVFNVTKDHATGYLSTPKESQSATPTAAPAPVNP